MATELAVTGLDMDFQIPAEAAAAVLKRSEPLPETAISVQGPDFDKSLSLQELLSSYERIGFQATSLGEAVEIVNRMVRTQLSAYNPTFYPAPFSENGVFQTSLSCQMNRMIMQILK